MADRVSKKMVENQFAWLCNVLGKRIAKDYKDVGAWMLESERGTSFEIVEIGGDGKDSKYPINIFGHHCYTAREMFDCIQFALRAIQLDRLNGADSAQYWPNDKATTGEK